MIFTAVKRTPPQKKVNTVEVTQQALVYYLILALVQTLSEWCWNQSCASPPKGETLIKILIRHCHSTERCFEMIRYFDFIHTGCFSHSPHCRHSRWSSSEHSDTCTGKEKHIIFYELTLIAFLPFYSLKNRMNPVPTVCGLWISQTVLIHRAVRFF